MTGRTLVTKGSFTLFDSINIYNAEFYMDSIKIVTYLDYNSCMDCMIKPLYALEQVIARDSFVYDKVNILAVVDSLDLNEAQSSLRKFHLKSIIVVDPTQSIIRKNKLDELLSKNKTFILGKGNKILFTGNPALTPSMQKPFRQILHKLFLNDNLDN